MYPHFENYVSVNRTALDNPIYRDMVLIQIEPCGAEIMRVINLAEKEESTGKCRVGRGYEFAQKSLTSNC